MRIRTLIVDDEPLARLRLRNLLRDEPDVDVVGECADGESAILEIERRRPDLVFLDVQMPELGGFDVIEAMGATRIPLLIFVTAYDQHALRAFEVHALDYLLKPFEDERFRATLRRARVHLRGQRAGGRDDRGDARLRSLVNDLSAQHRFLERIVVRSSGRVFFLRADEIDWIEAADNYVRLHLGRSSHLLRETLKELERKLDPAHFVRIHRSAIVRVDRIKEMQPWFHGEYVVILRDGTRLHSSRTFSKELREIR
ncbi:MAG: LytR/AlgR family response regulator transcription factor [Gemmatimonadaceae bacterium]